jgi:hypothetical protein
MDQLAFLEAVQMERYREMGSEGWRRHDLIRWGIFVERILAVNADMNNTALPTSAQKAIITLIGTKTSSRNVLFPIPAAELSLNTAMTQNPGW